MCKKQLLFGGLIIAVIFSSCSASKMEIDRWVGEKYAGAAATKPTNAPANITFKKENDTDSLKTSKTVTRENKKSGFLFSAKWHYLNVCTINENIPYAKFCTAVTYYSVRAPLKDKINGKTIEISVDTIPNVFYHDDSGGVGPFSGNETVYIAPEKKSLVVTYRILKDNAEIKSGTIRIPDACKALQDNVLHGAKQTTLDYLERYDESVVKMSKTFVEKLALEIPN